MFIIYLYFVMSLLGMNILKAPVIEVGKEMEECIIFYIIPSKCYLHLCMTSSPKDRKRDGT